MCLNVNANGWGSGEGTHVSVSVYLMVFVYLMQGEYDDNLLWPFRGAITFRLVNQRADEGHVEHTVDFDGNVSDDAAGRVTDGE